MQAVVTRERSGANVASQVVTAAKRYRISLLLDAYGELLTEKQRTFLRHYFEEDLSFGEIAQEYGVSRQAIFDSVKHGEESLEHFERVLCLVRNGRGAKQGQTASLAPDEARALAEQLGDVRAMLSELTPDESVVARAIVTLDTVITTLRETGGERPEDV